MLDKIEINTKNVLGFLRNEAIILALIPISANVIVFSYDYGYLSYFGLSADFVKFSINRIFVISIILIAISLIIYQWGYRVTGLINKLPKPISYRILSVLFETLLSTTFIYAMSIIKIEYILFFVIIFSIVNFIPLPWKETFIKSYEDIDRKQLERREKQEQENNWIDPFDKIFNKLGVNGSRILLGIVLIFCLGRISAKVKSNYYVLNTDPETVVLWNTDEYLIAAPFDRNSKTVERKISIIAIPDKEINISDEAIGPLQLNK